MPADEHYDAIVIGSSPMMLLVALAERAKGKSVCIVDKSEAVGGVWRSVQAGDNLDVEYACHLVEDFPGVYEYLERVSGEKFTVLVEQPIRVMRNGLRFPYSSRLTILLATAWATALMLQNVIKRMFGPLSETERERQIVLHQKVHDFFHHHLGLLIRGSTVRAPEAGYARFIHSLKSKCDEAGIGFQALNVTSALRGEGGWRLTGADGRTMIAAEVHATTAATLTPTGDREFTAKASHSTVTRSILVRIDASRLLSRVSYAAFWKDPHVVRVSRIDRVDAGAPGLLYLVQLRKGVEAAGSEALGIVLRSLRQCGVLAQTGEATVVDEIRSTRIPAARQLPNGLIAPGFRAYRSEGNLASGIAQWLSPWAQ